MQFSDSLCYNDPVRVGNGFSFSDHSNQMKEVNRDMVASSAVVMIVRESTSSPCDPLMLKTILFSPVARWLSMSLRRMGVERFFVISESDCMDRSAVCFPLGSEIVSLDDPELEQKLMAFATECDGQVICILDPVWLSTSACEELVNAEFLTPADDPHGVYRVDSVNLADGGLEGMNVGDYYSPLNDPEIQMLPLYTQADFIRARQLGLEDTLCRLMQEGVDIIDPAATYAEAGAELGAGTVLMPGTILRGQVSCGEHCVIGPNSMLTECALGKDCVVNASQVSFTSLPDGAHVGPFESVKPFSPA